MVQEASEDSSRSPEDTSSQEEYDSQETDELPSPGACPSPGAFQASQCTSEYANIDAVRPPPPWRRLWSAARPELHDLSLQASWCWQCQPPRTASRSGCTIP